VKGGRSKLVATWLGPNSDKLRDATKVVGWGLVLCTGVALLGAFLAQKRAGTVAAQAVLAEWGVGRLAVAWSDPNGPLPTAASVMRRAGRGALMALGAAALVLGFALATGAVEPASNVPVWPDVIVGLLMAGLMAMRDELLLRGLVIRAFKNAVSAPVLLLICGAAAAAARYGLATAGANPDPSAAWEALASAVGAVAFAALWQKDRGAWLAWGAHTAWYWAMGPMIRGGWFDLRWRAGRWGGGDAGVEASLAVTIPLIFVAAAAVLWSRREEG
jgi:hypothetical protein